jgi:very-short-patch-repair endonuclease
MDVAVDKHPGSTPPGILLAGRRSPAALKAAVGRGELARVRRGAYAARTAETGAGRRARREALARIGAVHAQLTIPFVFSHESAALLWGLDAIRLSGRTHIVQGSRPSARNDRMLARHVMTLPPDQRTTLRGLPVTTLPRTVLDCVRTLPGDAALVIADCAVRTGMDLDAVRVLLRAARGSRGIVAARDLLEVADGGAATPGESMTRWALLDAGLPRPLTQVEVPTRLGCFALDLGWPDSRVGVEFDGAVKYSGAFGRTGTDALVAEKRRQDALEEAGWRLLRVTWQDLRNGPALAARASTLLRSARQFGSR